MVDNKEVNYEQKNIKVKGKTIKCVSIDYIPDEQKTIEFRVECTSKLKSVPNFLILASMNRIIKDNSELYSESLSLNKDKFPVPVNRRYARV